MRLMRIFDAVFINQLLGTNARGETVYYPNGRRARGYLVPPERERDVRSRLRLLVVVSQVATLALVVVLPRTIESRLAFELPLSWFIGGAVVAVAVIGIAIIRCLSRIAAGLEPVSPQT